MSISGTYMLGYIYCIMDEHGRRKLGFADNVERRLLELQTGNADLLTIEYCLSVKNMRLAEISLHSLFAADKIRNEWFKITNLHLLKKVFSIEEITTSERKMLESLGLR